MSIALIESNKQPATGDETIDLQTYFKVIYRAKWSILSLAFAITILATVIVFSTTPKYTATATLLIQAEQANVVSIEQVYGIDSGQDEYLFTQFEILKSKHLAQRVIDKLNLVSHPEFDPDRKKENFDIVGMIKSFLPFLPQEKYTYTESQRLSIKNRVVANEFIRRLSISPIRKTQLAKISFVSESPDLAASIVNTLAEVYIESHLESKLEMTEKASTWLNDRLSTLKNKLDESERVLRDYQNKEQLIDIDGVKSLEAKELQELNQRLSAARQQLKQNEQLYQLIEEKKGDISALIALPEVLNHASIQSVNESLQAVRTKVSELQGVFGPKHPTMIAAISELRSVNENMNNQVQVLISGINNEYKSAKAQESGLAKAVQSKGQRFRELSVLDSKQQELKREVESNQYLYNAFFTRLKETKEVGEFESANARLVDRAQPPLAPSNPKKKLIIGLSMIISLVFGAVLAFISELLNDGIRSVDDIENKLLQRMLGLVPLQKVARGERLPSKIFFDSKEHAFSESIRTLRTSLLLLNIEHEAKVISVTSSIPQEGKTTVSTNLSFALAQLEKVLLIDADMRRPAVGKVFDLPAFQPGLSNIISGTHTLSECLVRDEQSGIDIIAAGTLPPNPQELLASKKFTQLIESVKEKYDRIIIDTAPTQAVSDAILIAQQSDSLVYIVKADSTREKVIKSGLSRLMEAGARIDGIVLNQVDLKQAGKYGEYTGYYDQYGYNASVSSSAEEQNKAPV
ncbi:GumC family protein [Thalassotalea atypica]|uniref:GumC family protein n=1 Tax=Thalassotalea atypica TaxID=2054316 RepID=UPI002572AE1C|nr:polysaccharide biosynthesis tyrosine autokinase [Thalassotalea atypica]